jgi:hypothetical protein
MNMMDRGVEDEEFIEAHSKLIELYRQNLPSISELFRLDESVIFLRVYV